MSFEELQKLKEKLGSKIYNETIFGKSNRKPKTNFKRANKNRPREMSSKRPVKIDNHLIAVKNRIPRDPRFDPLCGSYDKKSFKSNYGFLKDLRKKERQELQNECANTTDPQKQKKIKFLIQRLDNQIREQEKTEKQEKKVEEEKQYIKETLKKGERPEFKKKCKCIFLFKVIILFENLLSAEKKLEGLIEQYEELKKNNRLQKHIEKRSKKLARKEFKNMHKNKIVS